MRAGAARCLYVATTKGAIQNFTAGLAQLEGDPRQCRRTGADLDAVDPLHPARGLGDEFRKQVPMKRPGQPAKLATAFVMLADPLSSYVSGATIAVTGDKPIL